MHKNEEYICPHCGSAENVEVVDTEFDNGCMVQKMYCQTCMCDWREYFILEYNGFTCEGKEFNRDGSEVIW